MVQENSLKKVIVLVGPTGVGKTNISIKLAKKYNCDIINADQSQMRKKLNIGTAKITIEEMKGVKHHLIDFLEPTEAYSIKDFQDDARSIIDSLDNIPIVVGGSGLYVDALINDYDLSIEKRNMDNDNKYKDLSNEELYNLLYNLNAEAALKTHPNNRKRVLRYLEIVSSNGKLVEKFTNSYYDSLIIFLNNERELLYSKINNRCDEMFKEGWIEEVLELKNQGYNVDLIKEIGYRDIALYLEDINNNKTELLENLKNKIKQDTRHYAKRQITWFKNKMNCIEVINDENAFLIICNLIDEFCNN